MKARHIADAAFETAFALSKDWKASNKAIDVVYQNVDENVLDQLEIEVAKVKAEKFKVYLTDKLGYTPSKDTIDFIRSFKL